MHISPNDSNRYRHFTLPNALRVLLIQDESAQKSAAALAVNVGHFDDPVDRQGMAHYLEHMLFLGTKAYPKVGDFQSFISQHGGSNNAWTGTEHTCYFFDVTTSAFEKALDRFSQFFAAPLFNEEALDKERHAVDSEYKLKLNDDSRRLYQVQKETVNPLHPFAKFSVGNIETLGDREGKSIREEIIAFHAEQYSSDIMTLTLMGPQTLDEMEQWVKEKFSTIENKYRRGKSIREPFVTPEQTGITIRVEPLKEIRKLVMNFPMPNVDAHYPYKPLSYFAHLIGYEGEGSLLLALKDKGWITSLSAGGGASGSNYREFSISCTLTAKGLKKTDEIIQALFQYIRMIEEQGLEEWRYLEKRAVLESAFRFQETNRPMDIVSHLVVNMQHYAAEDTIYGDYLMRGYDEALLRSFLPYLSPENLRVTVIAQGQHYDKEANWYFTPYSVEPFSEEQQNIYRTNDKTWPLTLPPQNPFICYDLDPKPVVDAQPQPQILQDLPGFRLWHMQDAEFRVPKGVIYIAIDSPHSVANV